MKVETTSVELSFTGIRTAWVAESFSSITPRASISSTIFCIACFLAGDNRYRAVVIRGLSPVLMQCSMHVVWRLFTVNMSTYTIRRLLRRLYCVSYRFRVASSRSRTLTTQMSMFSSSYAKKASSSDFSNDSPPIIPRQLWYWLPSCSYHFALGGGDCPLIRASVLQV